MRTARVTVQIVTLALTLTVLSTGVHAGAQGSVTGTLFHDLSEDGVNDDGEPGLQGHPVELLRDNEIVAATESSATGEYVFVASPGQYTLRADTDFHAFFCVDSVGSFDPLSLDGCVTPEVPWAFTTAQGVELTVGAGQETIVDFGVREMDIMLLAGRAFYENGGSPPDTVLEAFFGGTKCGETELVPGQEHNYELAVMGAGEVVGCPEPGEEVTFTINGLQAMAQSCSESSCSPFPVMYEATGEGVRIPGLVAIKDYAVFWGQELAYPGIGVPQVGTVYASIDGACDNHPGAAIGVITGFFGEDWVGFSNLSVPSGAISPGCGYPGAEVHFRIGFNGPETGTVAIWEPGIHKIDVDLPQAVGSGDVNCDKNVDTLDALAFLRRLAALESDTDCWLMADVNCDGAKDALDVLVILQYVAVLPFGLPGGCPPVNQAGP